MSNSIAVELKRNFWTSTQSGVKEKRGMAGKKPAGFVRKWELTKNQAIIVLVIGSLLLIPALFIPTEAGSTVHRIKFFLGFLGACVIFVGIWRRR